MLNLRKARQSRVPGLWIIAMVILLMILLGYYAYANYRHEQKITSQSLRREGEAILQALEAGIRASIARSQWEASQFSRLLDELVQNPDVIYLWLLDENGRPLAGSGPLQLAGSGTELRHLEGESTVFWMEEDEKIFAVARRFDPIGMRPLDAAKRRMMQRWRDWCWMMGTTPRTKAQIAVVGLSTGYFRQAQQEDLRRALGTAVVLFLLGGSAFYFLLIAQNAQVVDRVLEETRTYAQNVVESISNGVLSIDREGRIVSINKVAAELLDLSPAEAVGRHYSEVIASDTCHLEPIIEQGERVLEKEMKCRTPGGREVEVCISASPLTNREGEILGAVVVLRDLRPLRTLEEQLRRSERLASLGQMVAGIAHELRNPLSSLRGVARYFEQRYGAVAEDREYAGLMIQEVDRLNRVIADLLLFAQPAVPRREEIILKAVVDHALRLCSTEIEERNIVVEQSFDELPPVRADGNLLVQVLVNLFLNAVEAMPEGGRLRISVRPVGQEVEIAVSDTGRGIPPDERERIFDPFFSTRPGGTGLGLSIAHSIVEAHGGRIEVESTPGAGTTFRIELPVGG